MKKKSIAKKRALSLLLEKSHQLIYDTVSAKFSIRAKDLSARYWLRFDTGLEIRKGLTRIDRGGTTIEVYEVI